MINIDGLSDVEWDYRNNISSSLKGGNRTYYSHNSAGERVRKVTEDSKGFRVKETIYVDGTEIFREFSSGKVNSEVRTLHVMDDKQRIALVEKRTIGSGSTTPLIRFQYSDHLQSASVEADIYGNLISYEEYYPYGGTSYHSVKSNTEISTKRYRFNGKEKDVETGLYYYGARYYAPWLCRWTTVDPIGAKGSGLNMYWFNSGNPVSRVDLDGMSDEEVKSAAYFFDGTWNDKDDPDKYSTHIAALFRAYDVSSNSNKEYMHGVGTRTDCLEFITGGLFGAGADKKIEKMMIKLEVDYNNGIRTIDIFGFSRGAAMAREFSNRVVEQYPDIEIRFLGIFDTVAQMGAPDSENDNSSQNIRLDIPKSVQYTAHAIAKNEYRDTFPCTSIADPSVYKLNNKKKPSDFVDLQSSLFWEKGFKGTHSEVGGGEDKTNLNALYWMAKVARSKNVPIDIDILKSDPSLKAVDVHDDSRYLRLGRTRKVFSGNIKIHSWKRVNYKLLISSFNY